MTSSVSGPKSPLTASIASKPAKTSANGLVVPAAAPLFIVTPNGLSRGHGSSSDRLPGTALVQGLGVGQPEPLLEVEALRGVGGQRLEDEPPPLALGDLAHVPQHGRGDAPPPEARRRPDAVGPCHASCRPVHDRAPAGACPTLAKITLAFLSLTTFRIISAASSPSSFFMRARVKPPCASRRYSTYPILEDKATFSIILSCVCR